MDIDKAYEKLLPELLFDEVKSAVIGHGGKVNDKRSHIKSYAIGEVIGLRGQIYASFPIETTIKEKSWFAIKEKKVIEMRPCFTAKVVGQSDARTKLMISADEDIIGMKELTGIQKDIELAVGSYEVKEG